MTVFFTALLAAALLYDAKNEKEFKTQLKLKDLVLSKVSYEELAGAYYIEFGDGETLKELVKQLKRL